MLILFALKKLVKYKNKPLNIEQKIRQTSNDIHGLSNIKLKFCKYDKENGAK